MFEIQNLLDIESCLDDMQCVIFDLDDTLYSEKQYVRSGFHAAARLLPTVSDAEEQLWQAFCRGEPAFDTVLRDCDPSLRQRCIEAYRSHTPVIRLYSGVEELLQRLRTRGLRLGMITDGRPEGQRAKLRALRLEPYFVIIIVTDELGGIGYRKPNPTAFIKMQHFFGVPYRRMAYVGDNPQKDFVAPDLLGMRSIFFHNEGGIYNGRINRER